ncbi:LysR family transcriptional regulator [Actinomycetospora sp. NBRC 106375]|uniref:LysR family transcriptional regulator n=1 Tax=Actinomycetospora sp. NBRC 106375 TaxID=3032207 RepID=UPI0024A195AD|nr:LysR substrate-binding domain-containing protein [Actinomycetospora sp. NBRC 106375]GLZ47770.1 LysR family transcriptional regulator [Actinomycetospora sp. NBRC 106375]
MPIDPHRLLVLRAVHRTGSVQAAAAALHLTASGVSQHLTRLESETKLALLDRTRRGGGRAVALTTAGLALAERADDVAVALAEASREADRLREGTRGTVRVGGFATALGAFVVPALHEVAVSDPALRVEVHEVTAAEGLDFLRAGELDLLLGERYSDATAPTTGPHRGLVEHDLCRDAFRVVVPRVRATPDTLAELLAGPWVTSPQRHGAHRLLDQLCADHGVESGHRHVCTESHTMLALVAAGLGATIVPDLTLSQAPGDGVREYATAVDLGGRVLTVTGPAEAHRSPATRRFHRLLREIAGGRGGATEAPAGAG